VQRPSLAVGWLIVAAMLLTVWSTASAAPSPNEYATFGDANERSVQPSTAGPVPGPPTTPNTGSRPANWPGGPMSPGPSAGEATAAPPTAKLENDPSMAPCEGAEILARVGNDVVLACDVVPGVDETLAKDKAKLPTLEYESKRIQLLQERLMERVQVKLVVQDVKRELPPEALKNFEGRLIDHYERNEIEPLMKKYDAANRDELNATLRALGTSIERERHAFAEQKLAQQWMRQKVKYDEEISLDAMLNYYRDHVQEFETPPQALWEELTVRFSKHPNRQAAYAAIAEMGNQVQQGVPFTTVAKQHSDGITAAQGGQREWTSQGAMVSDELNQALFGLPLNAMSQIIETKQGLHIIRVLQRKDLVRTPFLDAQVKIREKIREERTKQQTAAYFKKIQEKTPTAVLLQAYVQTRIQQLQEAQRAQDQRR